MGVSCARWPPNATGPRRRSPHCDVKLMMEKQVLGFQPASRLENVDNEDTQHLQDRKHRPG